MQLPLCLKIFCKANETAPLFENFLQGKFSNKKEKQAFLHQSAMRQAPPEGEAEDFGEKAPKKRKPGIRKDSKKQAYGKRKYLQRKTEYFRSAYAG